MVPSISRTADRQARGQGHTEGNVKLIIRRTGQCPRPPFHSIDHVHRKL